MTRSLEAQSQPQPHELDEASSSRIEMAMHVAAPITTRPSPPRAVHITAPSSSSLIPSAASSSSTRSCIADDGSMPAQSGNNNSNTSSGNTTTTTTSMKSRRVPPPKITPQDEALHTEPATTSSSSLDHGKDQFAALLALGVAQQQAQQQHILLQNAHRPTLNTNISSSSASSSTTTTASSSSTLQGPSHISTSTSTNTSRVNPSLSAFPTSTTTSASSGTGTGPYTVLGSANLLSIPTSQTKQGTALEPGPSNSTHMQGATPSSESSTSCLNEGHPHRQIDVSNNAQMNHLPSSSTTTAGQTVYQRPDRSDSTMSLLVNDTEQDHPSGAMNVLQQHRMNAIPSQNQSHHILSLNSRSTSSSSSHSSNNTPPNELTSHSYTPNTASGASTGGGGGKKLANILAAKWNNTAHNAVNKIQSSMIASAPISDSNGQDYNQSKGVTNYNVNSNITGMGESATEFNQRLFNSERRPPLVSASSSNSNSSTTTTSTSTTKASHGAISKFSARLRDVAHNISSSSSHSSSGGKDTRSQGQTSEELTNTGMYSPSASSVAESTTTTMGGGGGAGSNTGMSKSSSLRSLSAFGNSLNSLKTKKFSPSFPNSGSSTSLSSTLESPPSSTLNQAAVDSQSQHMSSGNASLTGGIRKITGFTHRSNPSTSSSSLSNAFNTLRNNSPLSSISSSLSSSNSGSSSSNPSSTSNMLSSNRRHHGSNQSISIGGNRSVSMPISANSVNSHGKMKNVLGVQIPLGRAGEVFGAPLNVAADRTRLIGLDGTGDDESEKMREEAVLKGIGELDEEGLNRRKEACMFLPASESAFPLSHDHHRQQLHNDLVMY